MDSYELRWKMSAVKELKALPERTRERVLLAITSLVTEPFPPGSRKLRGSRVAHRLRVGDYRVVYALYRRELVIEVVRLGHRREVYRDLDP